MRRSRNVRPRPSSALAALVLGLVVVACGEDEPGSVGTDAPASATALVGTEWQLVETSVGGETAAVPADVDAVVRFDGEGGWSANGCNHLGGGVEIDGLRLVVDGETVTTDMACEDRLMAVDDAIATVLDGTVDATATGEQLTLTGSGGDELRLEVRDGIFPSRTVIPLEEGTRGEGDYRFGYEVGDAGPGVSWESREAPGASWGRSGTGTPTDPHRPDPIGVGYVDEQATFVFGLVGADVARVAYEPPSGEATELALYPLGDDLPEWRAYGGFVERPEVGSDVATYDDRGAELGRTADLGWPSPEG